MVMCLNHIPDASDPNTVGQTESFMIFFSIFRRILGQYPNVSYGLFFFCNIPNSFFTISSHLHYLTLAVA
jgi:hypothetical protein